MLRAAVGFAFWILTLGQTLLGAERQGTRLRSCLVDQSLVDDLTHPAPSRNKDIVQ